MLSQDIEREYLNKQLEEVKKDIDSIQKEISELQSFTRLKEIQLEKKQNLKISLEKRLNNLSVGDNSLASYLNNEKVSKRDDNFVKNQQTIESNTQQISNYEEQIKDTKNIFVKADLMIQRKKLKIYNSFLNQNNVIIERNQRMYIAATRLATERKNHDQNFKVSVNNIKLRKMQEKYEIKITETHGLEEYHSQLQAEGHKIRSSILGKVISVYNKRDERVRSKFQKLLNTKSELLKIESARQFYDSYDLTKNQQSVLEGRSLSYEDIIDNVIQDEFGNLYFKDSTGKVTPVPPELWAEVAQKHGIDINQQQPKGKVA